MRMSKESQKLIDLTKCVTMLTEVLCERQWLLEKVKWENHSTTLTGLLVLVRFRT